MTPSQGYEWQIRASHELSSKKHIRERGQPLDLSATKLSVNLRRARRFATEHRSSSKQAKLRVYRIVEAILVHGTMKPIRVSGAVKTTLAYGS